MYISLRHHPKSHISYYSLSISSILSYTFFLSNIFSWLDHRSANSDSHHQNLLWLQIPTASKLNITTNFTYTKTRLYPDPPKREILAMKYWSGRLKVKPKYNLSLTPILIDNLCSSTTEFWAFWLTFSCIINWFGFAKSNTYQFFHLPLCINI